MTHGYKVIIDNFILNHKVIIDNFILVQLYIKLKPCREPSAPGPR